MSHESFIEGGIAQLTAEAFLERPRQLRETLEAQGTLTFTAYASGLFPASNLPPEMAEATGMGMAWLRDNAHIANALYESGRPDLAIPAGRAMLTILNNNRDRLDGIVSGAYDPADPRHRLPVRVHGDTLVNDTEPRVQNDSVGYALWLTTRLITDGAIRPDAYDLQTLAQTVRYLDKIRYWQDADDGHWEEDRRVHISSIGAVIAGLRSVKQMFDHLGYQSGIDIDSLESKGWETIRTIQARVTTDVRNLQESAEESYVEDTEPFPSYVDPGEAVINFFRTFSIDRRQYDAALLFLVEPLDVLDDDQAREVVRAIEEQLVRPHGTIRYVGDTYWEPRFKGILPIESRTKATEGSTDLRNLKAAGVAYSGTEAQWTLFDPLLSAYWGKQYLRTGSTEARVKQLTYLNRSLAQLVQTDNALLLPEAYYYEFTDAGNKWVPNDHTPLLWSQANLLLALSVFERSTQVAQD